MGKKKFIDKKKAATFQLCARDSSEIGQREGPDSDHVFVRVDNNPIRIDGFHESHGDGTNFDILADDPDSMFANASEDGGFSAETRPEWLLEQSESLPGHVRREILELGFPDDGYDYLSHMREIRNTGGGTAYYPNPKLNLAKIPLDVKAYDASNIRVEGANVEANEDQIMYTVAEKSLNVRVQTAVDPDVTALLNDENSQLGSDVEDLDEDFVVQANFPDEGESSVGKDFILADELKDHMVDELSSLHMKREMNEDRDRISEKPRARHLLDEQFDLLELQEYGTESDNDYGKFEEEPIAKQLSKRPTDLLNGEDKSPEELSGPAADVLGRCAEYAEMYENEDEWEVVVVEESSDESETWDCETIVSTSSNLDNHTGRIGAPEVARKMKLAETISGALQSNNSSNIISLRGKERLPVDYLPRGISASKEKVKVAAKTELPPRRQVGQESKEEKKERKEACHKVLILWQGKEREEATWMNCVQFKHQFPFSDLVDKVCSGQGRSDRPMIVYTRRKYMNGPISNKGNQEAAPGA